MPESIIAAYLRANTAIRKKPKRLPRLVPPDAAERAYVRELRSRIAALEEAVMPGLPALLDSAAQQFKTITPDRADSWATELAEYLARRELSFGQSVQPAEETTAGIASMVSVLNQAEIKKLMRAAFGVNLLAAEPWLSSELDSFNATNVKLISSLSSDTFTRIETITQAGVRAGKPTREITAEIQGQFKVSRSRANLIARDQVAKLNGNLTELRQRGLGVTHYIWRTSNDERVRKTHRAHEGVQYAWSEPPANTGHPGQDFQCRCWAEPVLEDV